MRIYTVHLRREGLDPDRDIVLVKEGFNWPALFFSLLWALWHGLWLVALGLVLAEVILGATMRVLGAGPWIETAISTGVAVIFAFIANDLHRWTLKRRGFVEAGVIAGSNRHSAEVRLFDRNPDLFDGCAS
ncbi:MAG: DUF2628 domain-containing protein [Rhodospirillales bacterium]|nr:DUF2628 domain-containing protein [Rhodospirillales bacterium]